MEYVLYYLLCQQNLFYIHSFQVLHPQYRGGLVGDLLTQEVGWEGWGVQ